MILYGTNDVVVLNFPYGRRANTGTCVQVKCLRLDLQLPIEPVLRNLMHKVQVGRNHSTLSSSSSHLRRPDPRPAGSRRQRSRRTLCKESMAGRTFKAKHTHNYPKVIVERAKGQTYQYIDVWTEFALPLLRVADPGGSIINIPRGTQSLSTTLDRTKLHLEWQQDVWEGFHVRNRITKRATVSTSPKQVIPFFYIS